MKQPFQFSDFNFELQVLIRAGEVALDISKKPVLEELVKGKTVDWSKVYHLACIHQIRPLLLRGITRLENSSIPFDILQQLKAACFRISARGLANTNEMLRLLEIFKENNILAVPYKGAYLANKYYGDFGLREFGDIDLLTKFDSIPQIKSILKADSYSQYFDLKEDKEKWNSKIDYDYGFYKDDSSGNKLFHLEIHYQITPSYYLINLGLDNSAIKVLTSNFFIDRNIDTLTDDAHVVYVTTHHGIKENWLKLKYIFDFKAMITKGNINWSSVIDECNNQKITPMLLAGLRIIELLFNESFINNELKVKLHNEKLTLNLLSRINSYNGNISNLGLHLLTIKNRLYFDRRITMVLNHLKPLIKPSKTDFNFVKTNMPIALYYCIRPFRIIMQLINNLKFKS